MAVQQMTRDEYVQKYGVEPFSTMSAPRVASEATTKPSANRVSDFVGGKGITDFVGAKIAKARLPEGQEQFVEEPSKRQVLGSAIQLGALALPGASVGAKFATKMAAGAGTGLALDVGSKLQSGETIRPGLGTAVGAALPVAGAGLGVANKIVGRLFKGLGSAMSGVSTKTIDTIIENPRAAKLASERLAKSGNDKVLEQNARSIINGVSKIRKEARGAFATGLEQLSKTDIDGATFRNQTQTFLDKYGVSKGAGRRVLAGVEFDDPKNLEKASKLIDRLSDTDLDGKSLRKLADDIESAKFKTATSDERLAFNAFLNDMAASLKGAVSASTGKLDEINANFSQDMQLAGAIEKIFGKVKFKNLPEVIDASKKLETLFAKRGLEPKAIEDFFRRVGIDARDFKTSEAVRQIAEKEFPSNTPGTSVSEIFRSVTGAVVTPEMIGKIARVTGLTQQELTPILTKMKPQAKVLFINALLGGPESQ